jgi:ABC-2 type transport system ATP-binding protein
LPAAIETIDLSKRYPPATGWRRFSRAPTAATADAVSHINLDVREGELFGLLGPNGAGKTTLVKILCTLILPTGGTARIGGHDLAHSDRVRALVGLSTGDERSFYWRLSGRQNLAFFGALSDLPRTLLSARVDEVLRQLGLESVADRPFQTYSSGMRQRLGIARALLHRPRILFLDEPTRSLDPNSTQQLHELIQEELLTRAGMTIFLTTHRLDEAAKLCDRVGIMHKGQLQALGSLDDLRHSLQVRHRFLLTVQNLPDEPAQYVCQAHPTLYLAPDHNGDLLFTLDSTTAEALPAVISDIVAAGGRIQGVQREEVSLEELFASFTRDIA